MKNTRLRPGFTLMEWMVVIAIITILAMIAMNAYGKYITRSKVQAAKADLVALSLNMENELQRNLVYGTHTYKSADEITHDQAYKSWHPSQKNSFAYSMTSTPTTYELKAMGIDGSLATCVLDLSNDTTGTVAGNCASVTTW